MKNLKNGIMFCVALLSSVNAFATEVTKNDIEQIHKDINEMYAAFESGDVALFLSNTHHSIYEFTGGKDNFEKMTQSVIQGVMEQGVIFHKATLGMPSKIYIAGEEDICFIPRVSVMEVQGTKMKSTGFLIAIRKTGSKEWKYLDGSGLRKDKNLLWRLLPKLSREAELPANFIEVL